MKIPKIIHYCWFGSNPIPELEARCIESWSKYLPDYELMFWNEDSFDISQYDFTRHAYDTKYYAFVSDFVRTWALSKYGGIYLDTDVEILSDLSPFLHNKGVVLGFENRRFVGTALMAFVPNHPIINDFYNHYLNLKFISTSGDVQITANPNILAEILLKYQIVLNGEEQEKNEIHIYPRIFFYPKKLDNNSFKTTARTVAIHHFSASWLTERQKKRGSNKLWIEICRPTLRFLNNTLYSLVGKKTGNSLETKVRNWLK